MEHSDIENVILNSTYTWCTDHTCTWLLLTRKHLSHRDTEAFISPYEKSVSSDGLLHVGVCYKLLSSQILLKGVQRDRKPWTSCCQPRCSPMAGVYGPPSLQCRSPTQSACYLNDLQHRSSKQSVPGDAHSAPSALSSQLKRISCGYVVAMGMRWRSCLRHCATCRKVAGSIPHVVFGIFL